VTSVAGEEAAPVELEALDHVGPVVSDMARSIGWYQGVLGLRRAHEDAWGDFPAVLEAGGSGVALFPNSDGRPIPVDDPMRHVGFRTSRRGLEAAKAELRARGIQFHEGDYGVAWSVYLPDPDRYQVEITTYEAGVGVRAGPAGPVRLAGR
jgi:catechol 2,3-dioxygenase-like lactoylglutathione lyase family enzyme